MMFLFCRAKNIIIGTFTIKYIRSVVKWSATQKTCSSDILELPKTVYRKMNISTNYSNTNQSYKHLSEADRGEIEAYLSVELKPV